MRSVCFFGAPRAVACGGAMRTAHLSILLFLLPCVISNHYRTLGVPRSATSAEIRKAYRKLTLRWHPDKWASADAAQQVAAENRFKELAAAWAVLGEEETRRAYDDDLERSGGGAE